MDAPLLPGKGQILFRGQDDILTPTVKYVSYLNPVNHGRANARFYINSKSFVSLLSSRRLPMGIQPEN